MSATVSLLDLYATLSEILGDEPGSGAAPGSVSLLPLLMGDAEARGEPVIHHSPRGAFAIRDGRWKLVLHSHTELYDLEQDPREQDNVAKANPEVVKRLKAALDGVRSGEDGTLSDDATLRSLRVAGIDIGTFASEVRTYTATVRPNLKTVEVVAIPTETDAVVRISVLEGSIAGGHPKRGQARVRSARYTTTISVTVAAPDGDASATYTVTLTRTQGQPASALTIPTGTALWSGMVDLEWNHVRGADSYEVQYFQSTEWVDLPGNGMETAFYGAGAVLRGVPLIGTEFRVRAANSRGTSDWSETVFVPNTNEPEAWDVPEPVNSPATGAPTVVGTPLVPETLTADVSGIADGNGLERVEFHHQWTRDDGSDATDIEGATEASYTLADEDVGSAVRVRVSFVDRRGFTESLTSDGTASRVMYPNNPARGAPAINGFLRVGETLTADASGITDADGLTNAEFIYQWVSIDGSSATGIPDATSLSYVLSDADAGRNIKVRASFTDDVGYFETVTSPSTVAVVVVDHPAAPDRPTGRALWSGMVELEWNHDPVAESYEVQYFQSSEWVDLPGDDIQIAFYGAGAVVKNVPLTAYWMTLPMKASWFRMRTVNSHGESGWSEPATIPLTGGPEAWNAPEPVNSPATGAPTISGTIQVGETLTADLSGISDGNGLERVKFHYQWTRIDGTDASDIEGASYTLTAEDVGSAVRVRVSFVDRHGFSESVTSNATEPVVRPPNTAAAGVLMIRGTAQVGQTLTADTSGIADADGMTAAVFSYQWVTTDGAVETEVEGATSPTYIIAAEDLEKTIRVRVSFTDDAGHFESLTSAPDLILDLPPDGPVNVSPPNYCTPAVSEALPEWNQQADLHILDAPVGESEAVLYRSKATLTPVYHIGNTHDSHEGRAASFTREQTETPRLPALDRRLIGSLQSDISSTDLTIPLTDVSGLRVGEILEVGLDRGELMRIAKIDAVNKTVTVPGRYIGFGSSFLAPRAWPAQTAVYHHRRSRPECLPGYMVESGKRSPFNNFRMVWLGVDVPYVAMNIHFQGGDEELSNWKDLLVYLRFRRADGAGRTIEGILPFAADAELDLSQRQPGNPYTLREQHLRRYFGWPEELNWKPYATQHVSIADDLQRKSAFIPSPGPTFLQDMVDWIFASDGNDLGRIYPSDDSYLSEELATLLGNPEGASDDLVRSYQVVVDLAFLDGTDPRIDTDRFLIRPWETADVVDLGDVADSALSVTRSGTVNRDGDEHDYFRLTLAHQREFQFKLTGLNGGAAIALEDANRTGLWSSDEPDIENELISGTLEAGVYYVRVSARGPGSIAYQFGYTTPPLSQDAAPAAPDQPTGTALWSGIVDLEWNDVPAADSYEVQLFHLVQWIDLPSNGIDIAFYGAGAVVRNVPLIGTEFRVRTVNSHGASGWSGTLSVPHTNEPEAWDVPEPVNSAATGTPAISGTAQVGETLTADVSGISDGNGLDRVKFHHQWTKGDGANAIDIEGETGTSYELTAEDIGITVRVGVSFVDRHGFTESVTSDATEPVVRPPNTPAAGVLMIRGTAQVGRTLTADTSGITDANGLTNAEFIYQWISIDGGSGKDISGATSPTYTVPDADAGRSVKIRVSFTDDAGYFEAATSPSTASVIAGDPSPLPDHPTGRALWSGIVDLEWNDDPGADSYEVQIFRIIQWVDLPADDIQIAFYGAGAVVRGVPLQGTEFRMRAVNSQGDSEWSETVSVPHTNGPEAWGVPEPVNSAATGAPTISGTLRTHGPLTAHVSGIADGNGLYRVRFGYQWLFSDGTTDTEIVGATEATYIPKKDDAGRRLRVRATFTDRHGFIESLTSEVTGLVPVHVNHPPVLHGPSNVNYAESGTSTVARYTADDPEDEPITWAIQGDDGAAFALTGGSLEFLAPPNFENPDDQDGDNEYEVEIVATDSNNASTTLEVSISVTDITDPNVIIILADEVGYELFGANGSTQYSTPHIDKLAREGVRFTNAHSKPCCSPSRVALMTGRSNVRNYIGRRVLPPEEYVIADPFREAGYATAIAGKWQLEGDLMRDLGVEAGTGFDTYCLWGTANTKDNRYWNASIECDGRVRNIGAENYGPDFLVDFLLEFLESNQDRPFFVYYSMLLSHEPYELPPQSQCSASDNTCIFKDMVAYMDGNVGRIHSNLKELGLLDNTIVVFTSDNGTLSSVVSVLDGETIYGDRATTSDVSTHAPLFIHVPGGTGGRVIDDLIDHTDFLPTLADAAGLTIPNREKLDGVSFWNRLQDGPGQPREWIYTYYFPQPTGRDFNSPGQHPEVAYARDKQHKLYHTGEMFDIAVDPHELYPLPDGDGGDTRVKLQAVLDSMPDRGQAIPWASVTAVAQEARPRWRPVLSEATVNGTVVTLTYAGILDTDVQPVADAFTMKVDGTEAAISGASISSKTVTLTLASPVTVGQAVTVSYTPGSKAVRHINRDRGHFAAGLTDRAVTNETPAGTNEDSSTEPIPEPPPNNPATGAPTISGTARVGDTLTVDTSGIADEDGLDHVSFNYQWLADDVDIRGATGSTYTLGDGEEGKPVKVRVAFADDAGNEESLTSAATAVVTETGTGLTAEFTDAPPSHDGSNAFTLRISFSEAIPTSYVTLRDDSLEVTGGTVTEAKPVDGRSDLWEITFEPDSDADVTVVLPVTADCGAQGAVCTQGGEKLSNRSELTVPGPAAANSPATGVPTITGTTQVGETLTALTNGIADADGIANAEFSYQWLADDADIVGANSSTYTLVDADQGKAIKVRVSFADDRNFEESVTTAATAAVVSTAGPLAGFTLVDASEQTVVGSLTDGAALTLDDPANGSYGIRVDTETGVEIGSVRLELLGAKTVSQTENYAPYSLYGDDNDGLHGEGLPAGAYTLRATAYSEGSLSGDDLGTLEVSFTMTDSSAEVVENIPATGAPTITGTAQVGETLTAITSSIEDADGRANATFSYQWLADAADITGATGGSYILADADEGKAIKVRVSFTDDEGNQETLTSGPTAAVEAKPNSPATGAPTITGTAQVGETLTADKSSIVDTDGLGNATFTYQWLADDADIAGETDSNYTLTDADEGKAIKVRVSFTDDEGNAESLTSAATAAVAAAVEESEPTEPTEPTEPPPAPTNLTARVNTDGSITLSWDAPDDDSVTGYQILRRRPTEGEDTLLVYVANTGSTATTATTYTDANVTAGIRHVYRVKAINAAGPSQWSNYARATP